MGNGWTVFMLRKWGGEERSRLDVGLSLVVLWSGRGCLATSATHYLLLPLLLYTHTYIHTSLILLRDNNFVKANVARTNEKHLLSTDSKTGLNSTKFS